MLLNELDEELTKRNIHVKVVFLCYFELLHPPKTEAIKNKDRFILMFAPITRTYMSSYDSEVEKAKEVELKAFTLNQFKPPVSVTENIAYLYEWQKIFEGDSFVFDYPLMWDECKDYGGIILAKTIYGDVNALKNMGLNGYVSCQIQRNFFPTGFCMYMLARTLYGDIDTYEEIKEDFFKTAFKEYGQNVYDMLEEISNCRIYPYMRNDVPFNDVETHNEMPKIIRKVEEYQKEIITIMEKVEDKFVLRHFWLFSVMLELVKKTAEIIFEKSAEECDQDKIMKMKKNLRLWLFAVENGLETRMDGGYLYAHVDEMANRK